MFQALVIPDLRDMSTRHWNPPARMTGPEPEAPGDEAPPGTPGTGEAICPRCGGSGELSAGEVCPECAGTGRVVRGVGGG